MVMHINEDGMGPNVGQTTGGELRELRQGIHDLRQQLTAAQAENEALRQELSSAAIRIKGLMATNDMQARDLERQSEGGE